MPNSSNDAVKIFVIIPFTRPDLLFRRALPSVWSQTRKPDGIKIVCDSNDLLIQAESSLKNLLDGELRPDVIINDGDLNISGAINTGIKETLRYGLDPNNTFIAILDDDDEWSRDYLKICEDTALNNKVDWVISGIIRFDKMHINGIPLSVPNELTIESFINGNPHVQGSNTFIRLSTLLMAGCYDENLPSTTDRDLCIRLLMLPGIRYFSVPDHLVYHYALDGNRLSSPENPMKQLGLEKFFMKYVPIMNNSNREAFLNHAYKRFLCRVNPFNGTALSTSEEGYCKLDMGDNNFDFNIVIGLTLSDEKNADNLVSDIASMKEEISQLEGVVLCNNNDSEASIKEKFSSLSNHGLKVYIFGKDEIDRDASMGKFGEYYLDKEHRTGISYGRTVLHRCLYVSTMEFYNPVVWIIDDDIRLNEIYYGATKNKLLGGQVLELIKQLKNSHVSIAVGTVGGDPPVPIMSMFRTQLLDLLFSLLRARNSETVFGSSEARLVHDLVSRSVPDYYYDFSTASRKHLETPVISEYAADLYNGTRENLINVLSQARKLLVNNVTRSVWYSASQNNEQFRIYESDTVEFGPVRGGNTLVFEMETLKHFTNASPRLGNHSLRRGDSLWVSLNRRVSAVESEKRKVRVVSVPLIIKQERSSYESPRTMKEKLVSDLLGSALVNSIDRELYLLNADMYSPDHRKAESPLKFGMISLNRILQCTDKILDARILTFKLNAWRIRGLISSIFHQLELIKKEDHENMDSKLPYLVSEVEAMLKSILEMFSEKSVDSVAKEIINYSKKDALSFLSHIEEINSSYSSELPQRIPQTQVNAAKEYINRAFLTENLRLIGSGQEGIVFSDGSYAYKYFIGGKLSLSKEQLQFLEEIYSRTPIPGWLVKVHEIRASEKGIIFKEELVKGTPYSGGYLSNLIEILRDSKRLGIVIKNIAPKNFLISDKGVVYVDVGKDLVPINGPLYMNMCKRAYLMYRWYFRKDLQELARKSLSDEYFPELFGFDQFYSSIEIKTLQEKLRPHVIKIFERVRPPLVLDFGTGNGWLADELSKSAQVSVYDKDYSRYYKRNRAEDSITVLNESDIVEYAKSERKFNMIFVLQVLCEIGDESEINNVLEKVRDLILPSGSVVLSVCNPFDNEVFESELAIEKKFTGKYLEKTQYSKIIKETGRRRVDYHRPFSWYCKIFENAGFALENIEETEGVDIPMLSPGSDAIIFQLKPKVKTHIHDATLLIKVSSMEWGTIDMQIMHIVKQLDVPRVFKERVVVTDTAEDGFNRKYDTGNFDILMTKLLHLKNDGIIDRIEVLPDDSVERQKIALKWFSVKSVESRSANGQPILATLFGFDSCNTKYILQLDSDCLIWRSSARDDYLDKMISVIENDPTALTVSFPIANSSCNYFEYEKNKKYRVEVRNCLISKKRLMDVLPLENSIDENGRLLLSWHRSLDKKISIEKWNSLRMSSKDAYYIHVPNCQKVDHNVWYNIIKSVEMGREVAEQAGNVNLQANWGKMVGERTEEMIVIVRGRDVPISKLRRCFKSLEMQEYMDFGLIFIDAGSSNGSLEYVEDIVSKSFKEKLSIIRNIEPLTTMENIYRAIKEICKNENSIIVMVDADDALATNDALKRILVEYSNGADVTVGSMLRTDKPSYYPVYFSNPRLNKGGNVWQHLRSFKKYLFDAINPDDLKIAGQWIDQAEDWAYMLPIVEMSSNPKQVTESIYFYEPSKDKVTRDRERYEKIIGEIVGKNKYEVLKNETIHNIGNRE